MALVVGVVALVAGQPYAVWYPLLLGGGICTVVFGAILLAVRARYRADELRRVQAMDAA